MFISSFTERQTMCFTELPRITAPSGRFVLRPFAPTDRDALVESINASRIAERVTNIPSPYTVLHAREWLTSLERERVDFAFARRIDFAIEINGGVVGSVAFIRIEGHRAQVSMWLSSEHRGRGIMPEALRMLVEFGQKLCGLVRIYAHVSVDNPASKQTLIKAGFVFESVIEKEWFRNGVYYDSYCYKVIADITPRSVK